ncbi:MAG: hypothetical protein NTV06_04130 [candidate division Zixibacteria bacterium]|nr:hypothetical protein [candidate division Zixibacteria bacterium]
MLSLLTVNGYCQVESQPLTLTIKSDKEVYKASEDIAIDVGLINLTDKSIYILSYFERSSSEGVSSGLRFNIVGPDSKPPKYIHREQLEDRVSYPQIMLLEPNQKRNVKIILNYWYKMDKPGDYEISADFKDFLELANKLAAELDDWNKMNNECIKKGCQQISLASNSIKIKVLEKNFLEKIKDWFGSKE